MAQVISGPLSYVGVNSTNPPKLTFQKRAPTTNDDQNFNIGDQWFVNNINLATPIQVWVLGSLSRDQNPPYGPLATWVQIYPSSLVGTLTFTGDVGSAVPTVGGVITLAGGTNINTDASVANRVIFNLNNNVSIPGTFTLSAQGAGVLTSNAVGLVTSSNGNPALTNGQILISGPVTPAWAQITSAGATVAISHPGPNTINLEAVGVGSGAVTFHTDTADAIALGAAISIVGGSNINTAGTNPGPTGVVTVNLATSPHVTGSFIADTTITAGTGITATTGNIVASTGNITASVGNIVSTLGSVSAATTVTAGTTMTAGTGITATTGNIVASTGNITSTAGSVNAGTSVSAGTTVTGGTGVVATTGNVTASAGNIIATLGNISATAGSVNAGTTVTAGTGLTVTAGNVTIGAFTTDGLVYNSAAGVLSTHSTTNHAIQVGNASGQLTDLAIGATGTVLVGNTAANPSFAALSGLAVTSIAGTAFQITASAATGAVTLSLPNAIQAPGSLVTTTTLTGGTGITATTGNIAASAGNVTASGSMSAGTTITAGTGITATTGNITASTGDLVLTTGDIKLPLTTAAQGQIQINSVAYFHAQGGITNVFVGGGSGNFTATSTNTTAVGRNSANALTSGSDNTFVGFQAGLGATSGAQLTAVGSGALQTATTTSNLTAVGYNALNLATGAGSCAFGHLAGAVVSTGASNTLIGQSAGVQLTTGGLNTAVGNAPLNGVVTGSRNVAIGQGALANLTAGDSDNIGIGAGVTGTAGDNHVLTIGNGTGTANGNLNKAFISGIYNIAVGATAGVVIADSGDQIGSISGAANTILTGGTKPAFTANPTASGTITGNALASTTTVTAGTNLLLPLTSAAAGQIQFDNTIFMHMYGSSTGHTNLFLGPSSGNFTMTNNTAVNNVGVGKNTLSGLTTGVSNVAVGAGTGALSAITTGSRNIAIGTGSADGLITGDSDNIIIGSGNSATGGISNNLIIGNATGTGNGNLNKATICGITGKTSAAGVAVLVNASNVLGTTTSSRVFKDNIQDMGSASDIIYKMRPVTFTYKKNVLVDREDTDVLQYGLIAEELEEFAPELVAYKKDGSPYAVRYHFIHNMLINEIQRLNKRIEVLEGKM